jgi:hypothetical protein
MIWDYDSIPAVFSSAVAVLGFCWSLSLCSSWRPSGLGENHGPFDRSSLSKRGLALDVEYTTVVEISSLSAKSVSSTAESQRLESSDFCER